MDSWFYIAIYSLILLMVIPAVIKLWFAWRRYKGSDNVESFRRNIIWVALGTVALYGIVMLIIYLVKA